MADDAGGNTFEWIYKVVDKATGPLKSMGASWGGVSSALSKATGFFHKAISASSELTDIYLGLGINVKKGSAEMRNASKVMGMLEGKLGYSAQEAKALVNQGQGLAMFGQDLENWAQYTGEYAKATDQSASSVGDLFFSMHKLHGLGTSQLRGMGAAMKYIGDTTAFSHDELTTFMKGLDEYFLRLPNQSKDTRAKVAVDIAAIAGAFKDEMGDPNKIANIITKIKDPMSIEGRKMASMFGMIGGMSREELLESLTKDPAKAISKFAIGMSRMSEKELQMRAPQLGDFFGFNFQDLKAFQKMADKGGGTIEGIMANVRKAREEYEKEARAKEKAAEVTNWYLKQQELFRRQMLRLYATIGKPLIAFVTNALKPFMKGLNTLISTITGTGGKGMTKTFAKFGEIVGGVVRDALIEFSKWIKENKPQIQEFFRTLKELAMTALKALSGWFKENKQMIMDVLTWVMNNLPLVAGAFLGLKVAGPIMSGIGGAASLLGVGLKGLGTVASTVFSGIKVGAGLLGGAFTGLGKVAGGVFSGIRVGAGLLGGAFTGLGKVAGGVFSGIKTGASVLGRGVGKIFTGLGNMAGTAFTGLVDGAKGVGSAVLNMGKTAGKTMLSMGKSLASMAGSLGGVIKAAGVLGAAFAGWKVGEWLSGLKIDGVTVKEHTSSMMQDVLGSGTQVSKNIESIGTDYKQAAIKGKAGGFGQWVRKLGKDAPQELKTMGNLASLMEMQASGKYFGGYTKDKVAKQIENLNARIESFKGTKATEEAMEFFRWYKLHLASQTKAAQQTAENTKKIQNKQSKTVSITEQSLAGANA